MAARDFFDEVRRKGANVGRELWMKRRRKYGKNRVITKFNDLKIYLQIEHSNVYIISNNYHKLHSMKLNHTQYSLKFKFL
jgi:hypothetical protein